MRGREAVLLVTEVALGRAGLGWLAELLGRVETAGGGGPDGDAEGGVHEVGDAAARPVLVVAGVHRGLLPLEHLEEVVGDGHRGGHEEQQEEGRFAHGRAGHAHLNEVTPCFQSHVFHTSISRTALPIVEDRVWTPIPRTAPTFRLTVDNWRSAVCSAPTSDLNRVASTASSPLKGYQTEKILCLM